MARVADLTGRRFGRLVVIERAPSARSGGTMRRQWLCRCDCGGETVVPTARLTAGNTRSDGCLAREMAAERRRLFDEARLLGLKTSSPTWGVWRGLVLRATVPITESAAVQMDSRWLGPGGFARFVADMGERPSSDHRLERTHSGPYTKSNCAWARVGRLEGAA